jgi:Ni,Fe-hydrogenase I large subunit
MTGTSVQALAISPIGGGEGDLDGRNAALIMKGGVFDAEALVGTPIADPGRSADPVEVGHVCRQYDVCVVCTVHAYDTKAGGQLARFQTT